MPKTISAQVILVSRDEDGKEIDRRVEMLTPGDRVVIEDAVTGQTLELSFGTLQQNDGRVSYPPPPPEEQ